MGGGSVHVHRAGLNYLRTRLARGQKVTSEDHDRILNYARSVLDSTTTTERDKAAASKIVLELERQAIDVAKTVDEVDAPREQTVNHNIKAYEGFDPSKVGGA